MIGFGDCVAKSPISGGRGGGIENCIYRVSECNNVSILWGLIQLVASGGGKGVVCGVVVGS